MSVKICSNTIVSILIVMETMELLHFCNEFLARLKSKHERRIGNAYFPTIFLANHAFWLFWYHNITLVESIKQL